MDLRIALAPVEPPNHRGTDESDRRRRDLISAVIAKTGARMTSIEDANALVWLAVSEASALETILDENPAIKWVQLPWAGVETFAGGSLFARPVTFTCAKGSYGEQVGEHALMQILICLRQVVEHSRIQQWHEAEPQSLHRKRVTILGGGGIATALIQLLQPFNCRIRVLRRNPTQIAGVNETLPITALHEVLPHTDVLVLALALTPETHGIIGINELELLPNNAVIANVARGGHIDTNALVKALDSNIIAAAALDVTEPEPLPKAHPLWQMDNVYISSHCADAVDFVSEQLALRIENNALHFLNDEPLEGVVDPSAGY